MDFSSMIKRSELLVKENQTVILTATGVVGTVTTAYLTGRASFKAAELIEREKFSIIEEGSLKRGELEDFDLTQQVKLVWPLYIPSVGVGGVTVLSIIMANRLSSKKATALAAAYGISERAFSEYKEKVVEKLGETKAKSIRDEVAQDRVTKNPPSGQTVIIAGSGDVLCQDALSGRYFLSSIENIKAAVNKINYNIINGMYESLSAFYDEIKLPPTSMSDELGWNMNNTLDVVFSTTISEDNKPCVVMDFVNAPVPSYQHLY